MAIPNPNPNIADGMKCDNKTYSSNKIESLINAATELPTPAAGDAGKVLTVNAGATGYELDTPVTIDDAAASDSTTYSSNKINEQIEAVTIRYYDIGINLATASWTASGAGKYYTPVSLDSVLPAGKIILSVNLNGWNGLRDTDMLIPSISSNNRSFTLTSNTNTFNDASVGIRVLYG